jgi:hypothetical protein
MDWIISEEGVYQDKYQPQEQGDYRISVKVEGWDTKPVETDFRVAEPTAEDADTGLKEDTLKEMVKIAGGQYFTFATANELPAQVRKAVMEGRISGMKPEDREIWDMPLLFGLALGLMITEWSLRRKAGLS